MEESSSSEVNSDSATQEIPHFYETQRFNTVFTKARIIFLGVLRTGG
jgi:hypothetical protein